MRNQNPAKTFTITRKRKNFPPIGIKSTALPIDWEKLCFAAVIRFFCRDGGHSDLLIIRTVCKINAQVTGVGGLHAVQLCAGAKAKGQHIHAGSSALAACREAGLLVLTAKTRLRLLPPLTLSEHDVDMALEILSDVLGKMEPTAPKEQA